MYDRETDRSKGFAFATFADEEAVGRAMQASGIELEGKPVRSRIAECGGHWQYLRANFVVRLKSRKPSQEVQVIYPRALAATTTIIVLINSKVTWAEQAEGSMDRVEVEEWAVMPVDLTRWQWR